MLRAAQLVNPKEIVLSPDDLDVCPICNGELRELGQLGHLVWHRCRRCGMDFSAEVDVTNLHPDDFEDWN